MGALIIQEEPDETWPYIAAAQEKILFVHAISEEDADYGQLGELAIRNEQGEIFPQIVLRPGEVQRGRLINASPSQNHFIGLYLKELGV